MRKTPWKAPRTTAVCAGTIALPDAQRQIATDWHQLGKDLHVIH
jgi:hypothetical protein